jgi:hypothetical protein
MRRLATHLAAAVVTCLALTACGTGASLGKIRTGTGTSSAEASKKDCAACKKMCEVGGSAEDNEGAVAKCKADCDKSCK